jgi:hypothetical protein
MKNDMIGYVDFESKSVLLNKDGQVLANVKASFSPSIRRAGFRLPESINVQKILEHVSDLRTSDNKQFRILNLRRCTAFHQDSPEQPHLEFDF